ncbi:MAG TPA: hypothetical protein VG994_00720 [Steroidobacteraceae bacterium]|nr:hypothetical protein [Steroidobacteraceae bacterium]
MKANTAAPLALIALTLAFAANARAEEDRPMSRDPVTAKAAALPNGEAHTSAAASEPAHPDFSGVWLPDGRKNAGQWPKQPPFTPAMKALRATYAAKYLPQDKEVDDENTSCIPYGMLTTMLGIAQYPFEILSTPTQLTLLTEIFGSVRRIYLDGRRPPPELLPSRMGFSTGHWEGATLVVETTHLTPENEGSARAGSAAQRIVERFSVVPDAQYGKELVDEITVYDPTVYAQPITVTMRYKWAPDVQVGEYLCQQDIWDQNKEGHPSEIPWRK